MSGAVPRDRIPRTSDLSVRDQRPAFGANGPTRFELDKSLAKNRLTKWMVVSQFAKRT